MSWREARVLAARLRDAGHQVVFAGGAVRDRLLGRAGHDVDLATSATPAEVSALFEHTLPVGAAFGVVLVVWKGETYDVATFRKDVGTRDGRRPAAVEAATLEEDVQRRDLTINGLMEDPFTGDVIDRVGGLADLENRLVRCIGDPATRFREDGLRLLRAVRFAASLGFGIEPGTEAAMRSEASCLRRISGERVHVELARMLAAPSRVRAVELLERTGLLDVVLPEACVDEGNLRVIGAVGAEASFELVLAALLGVEEGNGARAQAVCARLRLSRVATRCVTDLVRDRSVLARAGELRSASLRRLMAAEHFDELVDLYTADCRARSAPPAALAVIDALRARLGDEALVPAPWIDGQDVVARGVAPGPDVGRLLREAYDLQLDGALTDRAAALAWLAAQTQRPSS